MRKALLFLVVSSFSSSTCKYALLLGIICLTIGCQNKYPDVIHVEGGKLHVQGIALDKKEKCLYCSFTSAFFKTDLEGNIIGSVTGINGHLGAMTYDKREKKVYASLEIKDDEIGRGISDVLGKVRHEKQSSTFYVAEIDVGKVNRLEVPFEEAFTLHVIDEVAEDYLDTVTVNGMRLEHRYGCSGMDGIAIAPEFGSRGVRYHHGRSSVGGPGVDSISATKIQSSHAKIFKTSRKRKAECIYLAYGIYGDTTRTDNDYNILLCFKKDDLKTPIHKYFVKTGNTRYGVQNMAYDKTSERLFLAVYKGQKSAYPNYSLFSLDINQEPFMGSLEGVPYESNEVEQLRVTDASHFRHGSTGLYSFGDGRWYVSHKGKKDGVQYSDVTLYQSLEE